MTCYLVTPMHFLKQCRLISKGDMQHSSGCRSAQYINSLFENYIIKITATYPRGQWVEPMNCNWTPWNTEVTNTRVSIHQAKRRLIARSREFSKPWGMSLVLYHCSEIWQASRQHYCRSACQISERWYDFDTHSRGFEVSEILRENVLSISEEIPWCQV